MKNLILIVVQTLLIQSILAQSITDGNNKFAFNLLQKLANNSSNSFFSPYSISTALSMTTGAARTETEKQMLDVLCLKDNSLSTHKAFGEIIQKVEKKEKIQLNIANSIWMQKGFKFNADYLKLLETAYKANLKESDFKINPDNEAKRINKWVEDKTKQKIKNLIKPGILKNNTRMVLVNAIYFYGDWSKSFNKDNTKEGDFYTDNNSPVKAKFMNAEYSVPYVKDDVFEVVSVPYSNNEATMLIFLPKEKGNFTEAIKKLDFERYNSLNNKFAQETVNLKIPKFTMTAEFELSKTLTEMGMPLAFTDLADFSGMTPEKNLKIDKVIHKAFIDVSEKGTEAAAATAVVVVTKSVSPDARKVIYFKADHPFIFLIKENSTGQILFLGVMNNPAK
ncbi:MAG: serpin family protein [Bacteroidales bacterium]